MDKPCPICNQPWSEHEFAVPAPYCPEPRKEVPKVQTVWNKRYYDPLNEVSRG